MLERGAEGVMRRLANVHQVTLQPLLHAPMAPGTLVYTAAYAISSRLAEGGDDPASVCHRAGQSARDDEGDGFCAIHVTTMAGFGSLLRSWRRPHRGISQAYLPLSLGFVEFVHHVRRWGKALLGALLALWLT
jgi:transposase